MYKRDCRHFRGDKPCQFHKDRGWNCKDCSAYDSVLERILIIKLGAIGDVIRTTPLLRILKKTWPKAEIWWLTRCPEAVPTEDGYVDRILSFMLEDILQIQTTGFDIVYNLDKDKEACALMNLIRAPSKFGFWLDGGKLMYYYSAKHKFLTGIDDSLSRASKKSYQEEIFEICDFEFKGEEYIINKNKITAKWNIQHLEGKKIIGLNTGCGVSWRTRLWKVGYWIELAEKLRRGGHEVILLGGEEEDDINRAIVKKSGALYYGYFPFKDFVNLMDSCHLIVTAVTAALHIALGLKKEVIVFNNIFNKNEFYTYGRLRILEPEKKCKCYFESECKNPDYYCMDSLKPQTVLKEIENILNKK